MLNCLRLRYTEQSDVPCKKIQQYKLYNGNTKLPFCGMMLSADPAGSEPEKTFKHVIDVNHGGLLSCLTWLETQAHVFQYFMESRS